MLQRGFLDRTQRKVLRGSAYGFIADVDSVDFDSCRASETATKRNRRESVLGGIEGSSVLNLNSRLQLCQVEKVTAVNREILNLLAGQHSLHRGLLGVDYDF